MNIPSHAGCQGSLEEEHFCRLAIGGELTDSW